MTKDKQKISLALLRIGFGAIFMALIVSLAFNLNPYGSVCLGIAVLVMGGVIFEQASFRYQEDIEKRINNHLNQSRKNEQPNDQAS